MSSKDPLMGQKLDRAAEILEGVQCVNGLDIKVEKGVPRFTLHVRDLPNWSDLDAPLREIRKVIWPFNVTVRTDVPSIV